MRHYHVRIKQLKEEIVKSTLDRCLGCESAYLCQYRAVKSRDEHVFGNSFCCLRLDLFFEE